MTGCSNKNKITDEFLNISWYFYTISLGHPVYTWIGTSITYVWDTLYIPDLVLLYNVNGTPCIYLTWYFYSMCMGHPVYTWLGTSFYTMCMGHPVYTWLGTFIQCVWDTLYIPDLTSIPCLWDTLYIPDLVLLFHVYGTPCIYLTWYFYSMDPNISIHCEGDTTIQYRSVQAMRLLNV